MSVTILRSFNKIFGLYDWFDFLPITINKKSLSNKQSNSSKRKMSLYELVKVIMIPIKLLMNYN